MRVESRNGKGQQPTWLLRLTFAAFIGWLGHDCVGSAQTLTVRLMNAQSGKPIRDQNVTFVWCPDCFRQSVAHIGKDGSAQVPIPQGAATFAMMPGPRIGREPERVAFVNCNGGGIASIGLKETVANGIVPKNDCGQRSASPRPGEIVFWALPLPWWKPDYQ